MLVALHTNSAACYIREEAWAKAIASANASVEIDLTHKALYRRGVAYARLGQLDEAKDDLMDIVKYLRQPKTFTRLGGKLPKGCLLTGPPGTGKTLLARVMAAQARVPFFYCSGSDFVELFVGRGAARMRSLFKEAAAAAPCLVFVDELDALGKQRSGRLRATIPCAFSNSATSSSALSGFTRTKV